MKILVAEPIASEGIALLSVRHEVDLRVGLSRQGLLVALPAYDALLVRSQVRVDARVVAAGTRLKVIGRAGAGLDNVDLEAATQAGIVVVNAPSGNTVAAAEHTLALLFALARHVAAADASIRRGEWNRGSFVGLEVSGKTLGIVGLGRIGLAVAARARALGMQVIGADPFFSAEEAVRQQIRLLPMMDVLACADVVTLHVPGASATRGLIGAEELARMKPTALLLNVSRGTIVDEAALSEALRAGRLAGAGLDVYAHEPPAGSPILGAPNTVLTPHLGASTVEAQVRVAVEAAEQVLDVLEGRPARYAVNAQPQPPEPHVAPRPR